MWTARRPNRHLTTIVFVAATMLAVAWLLPDLDGPFVESVVARIGPVAIVLLVALGIVVSPIPSGAIALVGGALYGTVLGGLLTIAGAVLGAAGAFALSRYFGRHHVARMDNRIARLMTRDRPQSTLMVTVFVTRLVPFISFDAVSYLAGVTPLRFWRFLVATAAGTTPVCLAFAHAGATASSGGMPPVVLALLCGITLVVPAGAFLARAFRPDTQPKLA